VSQKDLSPHPLRNSRHGDTADATDISRALVQRGIVGVHGRPRGIGRFFGEDMILEVRSRIRMRICGG